MKHVADAQVVTPADVSNHTQNPRQAGSRNDAVLRRVVRREAADRSESPFASLPQQRALSFVAREPDTRRAGLTHSLRDLIGVSAEPRLETFQLDDEHRARVERKPYVERLLDRLND